MCDVMAQTDTLCAGGDVWGYQATDTRLARNAAFLWGFPCGSVCRSRTRTAASDTSRPNASSADGATGERSACASSLASIIARRFRRMATEGERGTRGVGSAGPAAAASRLSVSDGRRRLCVVFVSVAEVFFAGGWSLAVERRIAGSASPALSPSIHPEIATTGGISTGLSAVCSPFAHNDTRTLDS